MTILQWTSPERAAKMLRKHRKVITAKDFNTQIRDHTIPPEWWIGHIGRPGVPEPSCGCGACQHVRFNMEPQFTLKEEIAYRYGKFR